MQSALRLGAAAIADEQIRQLRLPQGVFSKVGRELRSSLPGRVAVWADFQEPPP